MKNMFSKAAIAAVFLMTSILPSFAVDQKELPKLETQIFDTVVQLDHDCTGTMISSEPFAVGGKTFYKTKIITAAHCIQAVGYAKDDLIPVDRYKYDPYGHRVQNMRYYAHQDKIGDMNSDRDVALLSFVSFEKQPVAKLDLDEPLITYGETAYSAGFGMGLEGLQFREGHYLFDLSAVVDMSGKVINFRMFDLSSIGGDSGSCIFYKDAKGDYACTNILVRGAGNLTLAVPTKTIKEFMKADTLSDTAKTIAEGLAD